MIRTIAAILVYLGLATAALAQSFSMPPPAGVTITGCVYNSASPTLTAGQAAYVQCNADGSTTVTVNNPDCQSVIGTPCSAVTTVQPALATVAGNITTQNLNPTSGTPTASSTVSINPNGAGSCAVQTTGTYTGALTPQITVDGINWVTSSLLTFFVRSNGSTLVTITSALQDVLFTYPGPVQGFRITALGAMTGTAVVSISCSPAPNKFLDVIIGATADGSTASGNPLQAGGVVATSANTALTAGLMARFKMTSARQLVEKPFAEGESDVFTGAAPVTVTASNQAIFAAGSAGIRNYLTWYTITCGATWTANTIQFQSATTVIHELDLPAGAGVYNSPYLVSPPKTAAAAALNVKATGAVTGSCKISAGGFLAP